MEVRLLSVGARGFFLAASRLDFAASPLNSVAPNEKKNLWHPGYHSTHFSLLKEVIFSSLFLTESGEYCCTDCQGEFRGIISAKCNAFRIHL